MTTVPILIAAAVAVVTRAGAASNPRVDAYASFVGLAAAGALLVDFLLTRARRDVDAARARDAAGLSVRVRLVGAGDETEDVDASQVKPGEQVLVEPGETIGVDGIVTAGKAEVVPFVDSPAVITKREGDAVVAGASVVSGRLRVRATFTAGERAWVRLASSPAARVEVAAPLVVVGRRMVERGVPVAALVVAGATYANNAAWPDVVIAACAGAFGLSAVAAVAASALAHARGHVAAQRRGIVYKDAGAFDVAARADVAVVCSRGTILLGEPEIVVIEATPGREVDRVLALAAGAEMAAADALAAAVLGEARARGVRPENVRSALVSEGLGVTALVPNGDKVIVGSRAFLLKEKVSVAVSDARVSELEAQGRSVLLVALGGRLVGLLALQDGLRPGARAAVQRLHDARIEPVLLSGEARETCETIARALDIEHVRPEVLPSDRGAEVRALADGGHIIAAIGHAASDDGALGSADVSVAMGAAGSAPGEWGVALASDDVRDAALALTVPRACRERAKSAILVGGGAQAISLLGIAFGIAPPVFAPVMGVLAAACVLAIVREPTQTLRAPVPSSEPTS
ncbi:Lead, cadmium, zinc and mercury transporting ATPase [Labilithrix luteola]|uniref:P-type Zn(2+) transporter n=1 Tax=Labilithrix luteola TaxID=1391654 RepID=A0A0K1PN95_9BACT|nr:Lead, cadmium, zinc and mercury transporting ATPase [Labilithrix luteola]